MFAWFISNTTLKQWWGTVLHCFSLTAAKCFDPSYKIPSACYSRKLHCNWTQSTTVIVVLLQRYTLITSKGQDTRWRDGDIQNQIWILPLENLSLSKGKTAQTLKYRVRNVPVLREVQIEWSAFLQREGITASWGIVEKVAVKFGAEGRGTAVSLTVWNVSMRVPCCPHPNFLTSVLGTAFLTCACSCDRVKTKVIVCAGVSPPIWSVPQGH